MKNLLLVLKDGSELAANSGTRTDGRLELTEAAYTPCKVEGPDGCPRNPAGRSRQQTRSITIRKRSASNIKAHGWNSGLPVVPFPDCHTPPKPRRVRAFSFPICASTHNNGVEIEQGYYWRLGQNRNLNVAAHLFSNVAPMAHAQFRSFEKAARSRLPDMRPIRTRFQRRPGQPPDQTPFAAIWKAVAAFRPRAGMGAFASVRLAYQPHISAPV